MIGRGAGGSGLALTSGASPEPHPGAGCTGLLLVFVFMGIFGVTDPVSSLRGRPRDSRPAPLLVRAPRTWEPSIAQAQRGVVSDEAQVGGSLYRFGA